MKSLRHFLAAAALLLCCASLPALAAITNRNLAAEARSVIVPVPLSFETGEQVTGLRVYPPTGTDWRLTEVRYHVTKALANTDAGTIAIADAAGNAAVTTISLSASTAINTRGTGTLSTTDSRLRAGDGQGNAYHSITTAKTTAGGKVLVTFYFRRIGRGSTRTE